MSAPAPPKGHDQYEALAVAWAIDALEPADQEEFEGHRDGCDVCAAAVLMALQVATELAYGVPDVEPPIFLRRKVLAAVAPRPPAPGVSPEGSSGHGVGGRGGHQANRYGANADDRYGAISNDRDGAKRGDAGQCGDSPDRGAADEIRDVHRWDARNLDGREPEVETREVGRRAGSRGAHRSAAGRRVTGRWGGGPRRWGRRRSVRADAAGPGGPGTAGAGPAGRSVDRGQAVRGRRRALSVLAAAALVGLSAVTTWQVTRPAPATAPMAAERMAALSTQAGERTLATIIVRGDRANVVTDGLAPNAGRNTRYVVWGVPDGESGMPRVVGTFEVTAEGLQSYPVRLTQSLDGYPVLAVSEEAAGSTPSAPSRVLARGALGR